MNARQCDVSIRTGKNRWASMVSYRSHIPRYFVCAAAAAVVFLSSVNQSVADNASVTAVLSNSSTAVGEPVQLQIKVTGSTNVTPPGSIVVDGLDIRFTGQSQLLEGRNFQFTYSYVYNYTVMPLKAG